MSGGFQGTKDEVDALAKAGSQSGGRRGTQRKRPRPKASKHEDAVLECSCGKRKAPEHFLLCDKVRARDLHRLVGSCRDKIRTLLAWPPKKFANFIEKIDFDGKICPRIGTYNV
jgi:hypothetical protein